MEFRTYFLYFHTFSYKFKVQRTPTEFGPPVTRSKLRALSVLVLFSSGVFWKQDTMSVSKSFPSFLRWSLWKKKTLQKAKNLFKVSLLLLSKVASPQTSFGVRLSRILWQTNPKGRLRGGYICSLIFFGKTSRISASSFCLQLWYALKFSNTDYRILLLGKFTISTSASFSSKQS